MPSTYVPRPDAGVRDWSRNFAALVSADPDRFGMTGEEAAEVRLLADDFGEKLTTALEPSTRTTVAVTNKDLARAAMLKVLRNRAQRIRHNPHVGGADKVALGLAPVRSTRTPVAPPATAPRLQVLIPASGVHTLRFADESTPSRRTRPRGVDGLQLFVSTSEVPPTGPSQARFLRFVRYQNTMVHFPSSERGRRAHYWARWQTRRGHVGPWSPVVAAIVVA